MDNVKGCSKIHSAQNGFLLCSNVHSLYDQYFLAINPDDGYKVYVFCQDSFGYDGRVLDPVCRNPNDPHSVRDEILRWHFHQSILVNMRGAGEDTLENDFPPRTDRIGEVPAGPYGPGGLGLGIAAAAFQWRPDGARAVIRSLHCES